MSEPKPFDLSELNLRPSRKPAGPKAYHIPATGSPDQPARSEEVVYDLDTDAPPPAEETAEPSPTSGPTPVSPPPPADSPGKAPVSAPFIAERTVSRPLATEANDIAPPAREPTTTRPTGPIHPVAPSPFEADAPRPAPAAKSVFRPLAGFGNAASMPDAPVPQPAKTNEPPVTTSGEPSAESSDTTPEPRFVGLDPEPVAATATATIDSAVDTLIENPPHKPKRRKDKHADASAEPPPLALRDVREFVDPSKLPIDELDKLEGARVHPPRRAVNKYVLVLDEFENTPGLLDTLLREHAISVAGVNVQPVHAVKKNWFPRACEAAWVYGPINAARHGSRRLFQRARSKVIEGWLRQTRHPIRPATTCKRYGVKVDGFDDVNTPEFAKMLAERGVELLVCIGCHQKFSDSLRSAVPFGAINVHSSLLPHYRGQEPTLHTLADNQRTGGVSVHYATRRLNDGPVLAERAYTVHTHDTLADVHRRSREVAGDALLQAVRKIEHGTLTVAANPATAARECGKPRRRDVRLVRKAGRKIG